MADGQRKPKLSPEQEDALLTWLAADYSEPLIRKWFAERKWTPLSDSTISYHRTKHRDIIETMRQQRRHSALTTGLALKEERVARLTAHADELEAIKWEPDQKGRLWNEKAWRETLDDIAKEMGHRRQGVDLAVQQELETLLDHLRDNLPIEVYAQVLAVATGSRTSEG